MLKEDEVIAAIGGVICDALKEPNMPEHLCIKSGCIQSSTGGGECLSRRQAKAVVALLVLHKDILEAIGEIRGGLAP
jgi:hypothetical protein